MGKSLIVMGLILLFSINTIACDYLVPDTGFKVISISNTSDSNLLRLNFQEKTTNDFHEVNLNLLSLELENTEDQTTGLEVIYSDIFDLMEEQHLFSEHNLLNSKHLQVQDLENEIMLMNETFVFEDLNEEELDGLYDSRVHNFLYTSDYNILFIVILNHHYIFDVSSQILSKVPAEAFDGQL